MKNEGVCVGGGGGGGRVEEIKNEAEVQDILLSVFFEGEHSGKVTCAFCYEQSHSRTVSINHNFSLPKKTVKKAKILLSFLFSHLFIFAPDKNQGSF